MVGVHASSGMSVLVRLVDHVLGDVDIDLSAGRLLLPAEQCNVDKVMGRDPFLVSWEAGVLQAGKV